MAAVGEPILMLPLSSGVVIFDILAAATIVTDFVLISRKNTAVLAKGPVVVLSLGLVLIALRVDQPAQFVVTGAIVLGAALFGYANMLAFLKRGITFSILSNHARLPRDRRPDRDFIVLDERIAEMEGHGWLRSDAAGWTLTSQGRRVLRVRRWLLRLLNIEAVG